MIVQKTPPAQPENYRKIMLSKRGFALVDPEDFEKVNALRWRARFSNACIYAESRPNAKTQYRTIKMHRFIMQTPEHQECHHKNRNTLDNRKCNLMNLSKSDHLELHKFGL